MPLRMCALSLSLRQLLTSRWRQEDESRLHQEGQHGLLRINAGERVIIPAEGSFKHTAAGCLYQGNLFSAYRNSKFIQLLLNISQNRNYFYSNMFKLSTGLDITAHFLFQINSMSFVSCFRQSSPTTTTLQFIFLQKMTSDWGSCNCYLAEPQGGLFQLPRRLCE